MCLLEVGDILVGDFYFPLLILVLFVLLVVLLLVGWCLACRPWLFFMSYVTLVGEDDDTDISSTVLFNFLEPAVHIIEALLVSQIEDHENAVSSLVVCLGDCSVPLLARSVPDLQPHCRLIYLQRAETKVHSNCRHVILLELIILQKYN